MIDIKDRYKTDLVKAIEIELYGIISEKQDLKIKSTIEKEIQKMKVDFVDTHKFNQEFGEL